MKIIKITEIDASGVPIAIPHVIAVADTPLGEEDNLPYEAILDVIHAAVMQVPPVSKSPDLPAAGVRIR